MGILKKALLISNAPIGPETYSYLNYEFVSQPCERKYHLFLQEHDRKNYEWIKL